MAGENSTTTTLANLYRPNTFADVVGQPLVVTTLKRIAHADGIAARAIFMKGAFGSGKCQCGNDYVSTSYGYKKFKDIYPDAGYGFTPFEIEVEQPDGSFAKTSHFYKEKDAELLHLRCESGREYTGTAAHPKLAYRVGSDRVELVRCGDLRVGDYIARRWTGSIELYPDAVGASEFLSTLKFASLLDFGLPRSSFACREHSLLTLCWLLSEYGRVSKKGKFVVSYPFSHRLAFSDTCDLLDYLGLNYLIPSDVRKTLHKSAFGRGFSEVRCLRVELSRESSQVLFEALHSSSFTSECAVLGITKLLIDYESYLVRLHSGSVEVTESHISLGSYSEDFSSTLRRLRSLLPISARSRYDLLVYICSYARSSGGISPVLLEQGISLLLSHGITVPDNILSFCGVRFDRIVSIDTTVEDVYDVTVPSTHLFMSGNVVNHNTTTARIFARALNCDTFKQTDDVCNTCDGCLEASSVNSSTYWELDGTVIGNVEGIRALKERLSIVPNGRRVVCLDEVQSCTRSANDALLKVVEEGVPNTIFLFCGTEDIQPTLKSRCVNIDISVIPLSLIEDRVRFIANDRGISITDDQLRILAMKSQGHMRDALQLLQFYELAGERALDSSYFLFREFVRSCFAKGADPSSVLSKLLVYSTADIKMSVGLLIRNIFGSAQDDSLESKFQRAGLGQTLFSFFFSPLAQQALGSEIGTEILLRSLMERTAGSRKM